MGQESEKLRDNMQFWDEYPCGLVRKEPSKELLLELRKERYSKHPWLKDYINFEKWRGKKVLEIGCGIGLDASYFSEHGADIFCIDLSEKSLQQAKKIVDGNLICSSADTIQNLFHNVKFDLIYAFGVLHHIPNVQNVINQIYNILKEDGELIAMFYHKISLVILKIIIFEGIFRKKFFKGKKLNDLLPYAERGTTEKLRPYSTCYSKNSLKKLLGKFRSVEIKVYDSVSPSKFMNFVKQYFGWFLMVRARK